MKEQHVKAVNEDDKGRHYKIRDQVTKNVISEEVTQQEILTRSLLFICLRIYWINPLNLDFFKRVKLTLSKLYPSPDAQINAIILLPSFYGMKFRRIVYEGYDL